MALTSSRSASVHDDDVGSELGRHGYRFFAIAGFADDAEVAGCSQYRAQAGTQHAVIIGQQNANYVGRHHFSVSGRTLHVEDRSARRDLASGNVPLSDGESLTRASPIVAGIG